jgi:hypothetical protein
VRRRPHGRPPVAGAARFRLRRARPEAADLHLLIHATEKFDCAARQLPNPIAGSVHPGAGAGRERVVDEPLAGEHRWFKYPALPPRPPMKSSPVRQSLRARPVRRAHTPVFAIGRPIGTVAPIAGIRAPIPHRGQRANRCLGGAVMIEPDQTRLSPHRFEQRPLAASPPVIRKRRGSTRRLIRTPSTPSGASA